MMDAMRNMMADFTRDNGRPQSGDTEGRAAVGESPGGAVPTAVRETPGEAELIRDTVVTAVRETICVAEIRGISEQMNAEKLQYHLRLAQRGISQTSQGGLETGVHTPARWRQGARHLATA